jgi:hypothetical protein
MQPTIPNAVCACCSRLDRRRFLQLAGGAGLAATFPLAGFAAEDDQALLLICSDPRVWQPATNYMKSRDLAGKYRPFQVDGGAIGLVAEQYKDSRKAFWDELAAAVTWHQTKRIIALNHRDCGAARIAYGLVKTSDRLIETESHRYALNEFRKQVAQRNAELEVEIGLIGLDGKVEMFK